MRIRIAVQLTKEYVEYVEVQGLEAEARVDVLTRTLDLLRTL